MIDDSMSRIGELDSLGRVKDLSHERAHFTRSFATLAMIVLDSRTHRIHQYARSHKRHTGDEGNQRIDRQHDDHCYQGLKSSSKHDVYVPDRLRDRGSISIE